MRSLVFALLASAVSVSASSQGTTPALERAFKKMDELDAAGIGRGYQPPFTAPPPEPTFEKRQLGPIDRWRFESCMRDAAKAPKQRGVVVGVASCERHFGQRPE